MDKYTQYRKYNLYLIIISLITFLILLAVTVVFNYKCLFAAEDEKIDFNTTDVTEDLLSSTDNSGKTFDIRDYPIDTTKECRIINFVEYCYSYDKARQSDYALYIYVYNPAVLDIVGDSNQNKISIAIAYDAEHNPSDYHKFNLIFCNKSAGAYDRIFYKFRIDDSDKIILNNVNSNERRYDVAEIELLTNGNPNATAYTVGGSYRFTGYAKGYGIDPEAESTLDSRVLEVETIFLEVKDTFYRYNNAIPQQEQVNSVYFSVDDSFLNRYGRLQKIKAEWWEYKTQPIIIMARDEVYNALLPWVGVDIGGKNDDIGWILGIDHEGARYWGYNLWNSAQTNLTRLTLLFHTNGVAADKFTLDGDILAEYIYNYDKSAANGYLPVKDGRISADLFESTVDSGRTRGYNLVDIDADETFDLKAFDRNFWNWWVDFFYNLEDEDINGITPIYEVKPSDVTGTDTQISRNLFISKDDVSEFKAYCNREFAAGKTPFLFRFAVTDYFAEDIAVWEDKTVTYQHWDWAYKAQETVFLDFDIIQLTFNRDGVYHVIPVVQSPLDIIPDITPPPNSSNSGINWLMIIFIVIVVILCITIISRAAGKLGI